MLTGRSTFVTCLSSSAAMGAMVFDTVSQSVPLKDDTLAPFRLKAEATDPFRVKAGHYRPTTHS